MTKKDAAELVKAHFSKYKGMQTLHVTTDGQVFESENYAFNHAKSLDKKNPVVITVKREDLEEETAAAVVTEETPVVVETPAAEVKEEVPAEEVAVEETPVEEAAADKKGKAKK